MQVNVVLTGTKAVAVLDQFYWGGRAEARVFVRGAHSAQGKKDKKLKSYLIYFYFHRTSV